MKFYLLLAVIAMAVIGYLIYVFYFRLEKIELPERSLQEKVYVTRLDNGNYQFEFSSSDSHTIYQGIHPDSIDWKKPVTSTNGSKFILETLDFSNRYFFGFENLKGEKWIASERLIPMQGTANFRDLGGIASKDGRVIQWGKFYRSGKLNKLTSQDLQYFKTLGIKTVVDFRDDLELKKDTSLFPSNFQINYFHIPIGDRTGDTEAEIKKHIIGADQSKFDSEQFIAELMMEFTDTFAFQYQPFMDIVKDVNNAPVLFHCSAGKDRTGLGAAFLLSMLGVERKPILEDYLMTNFYRNKEVNQKLKKYVLLGVQQRVALPLLEARTIYLESVFEVMDKKYGGKEAFLEKKFGLGEEELEGIRDLFLR